jgi:hypothetical protein
MGEECVNFSSHPIQKPVTKKNALVVAFVEPMVIELDNSAYCLPVSVAGVAVIQQRGGPF